MIARSVRPALGAMTVSSRPNISSIPPRTGGCPARPRSAVCSRRPTVRVARPLAQASRVYPGGPGSGGLDSPRREIRAAETPGRRTPGGGGRWRGGSATRTSRWFASGRQSTRWSASTSEVRRWRFTQGPLPVPRREDTLVQRLSGPQALLLLQLRGGRRRHQVRAETTGSASSRRSSGCPPGRPRTALRAGRLRARPGAGPAPAAARPTGRRRVLRRAARRSRRRARAEVPVRARLRDQGRSGSASASRRKPGRT